MSPGPPSILLGYAHHHPLMIVGGAAAIGVWSAGYEIRTLIERRRKGTPVRGKEIAGTLAAMPAAMIGAGILLSPGLTARALLAAGGAALVSWGTILVATRKRRRRVRLHYQPLHDAIAGSAGHRKEDKPRSYLTIKRDLSEVRIRMTPDAAAAPGNVRHLKHTTPQVLQLGACQITEQLHGPRPSIVFAPITPPGPIPQRLPLSTVIPRLADVPGAKMIVQGIGAGEEMIAADFAVVVHELISAMTGSGKSNKTTFTLMQFLNKGAVGIVVDPTGLSYPWAKDLPNVFYARDDNDVRKACYWIGKEIQRRDTYVRDHADLSGYVEGGFGPDLIVVADEKNLAERRLNADWQARGNKGRDPALAILDDVHFAGRKIGIHAVVPMVRGDARAAGGGTVRGQAGLVAFGANPKQAEWDMFFRGDPVPVSSDIPTPPGRMQVCFRGETHELQIPHCLEVPRAGATPAERSHALEIARTVKEYALSGTVTPVPEDLLQSQQQQEDICDVQEESAAPVVDIGQRITLSEAAGTLVDLTITQLRWASHQPGFPEPLPERGPRNERYYRRGDIAAWEHHRASREPPPDEPGNVIQFRPRKETP